MIKSFLITFFFFSERRDERTFQTLFLISLKNAYFLNLGSFLGKNRKNNEENKWNHDKFEITLRSPGLNNVIIFFT